jgi:hypothetical protein
MAGLLAFGVPAVVLIGCSDAVEPAYFSLASQVLVQPCGTQCRGLWTQAFDSATGNSLVINRMTCNRDYPDPSVCNTYSLWSRAEGKRYFWNNGFHFPPDNASMHPNPDDPDDPHPASCCYLTPSPAPIQLPPGYGESFTEKVDRCDLKECAPMVNGDPLACEQALALAARHNSLGRRGIKSASVNCTTIYHVPPHTEQVCTDWNCTIIDVPEAWVQEEWNKSVEVSPTGLLLSVTVERTGANASQVKICDSHYPICTMSLGTGVTTEMYNSTRHVPDGYCELGTWWTDKCKQRCWQPQTELEPNNAPTQPPAELEPHDASMQPSDAVSSFVRSGRAAV